MKIFSISKDFQFKMAVKIMKIFFVEGDVPRGISINQGSQTFTFQCGKQLSKPLLDIEEGKNIMINSSGFFDRQGCNLLHFKSHREPSPVRVRVVQSSHMVHAPFKAQAVQNGSQESKRIKQSCHGFHILSRSSCLLSSKEKR